MDHSALVRRFRKALDTDRLLRLAHEVRASDIWCSADAFDRTAELLAGEARKEGLSNVENVQGIPGRGPASGQWTQWERWTVRGARLVEAATGECIADYARCPYALALFSEATPRSGVTAPVAICDDAALLETGRADVRGRLVLSRLGCRWLRPPALAAGAVGLIVDNGTEASDLDCSWQKMGFGCWPPGKRTFAFSISREAGRRLRDRIGKGESFRLTATVDTRMAPGGLPWVTATVPGRGAEGCEVLLQAHSCEPGVIDNASGVSAIWEIARVIRKLVLAGDLPAPRSTLRILAMYESFGLADFAAQRAQTIRRTGADVNVDCIGASGLPMSANRQPAYMPSFLEEETARFCQAAGQTSGAPWRLRDFGYGGDLILAEPLYNVPAVEFTHGVDYDGYHNSRDDGRHLDASAYADQTAHIAAFVYGLLDLAPAVTSARPAPVFARPGAAGKGPGLEAVAHRTHPGLPMLENLPALDIRAEIIATGVHGHALLWADGKRTLADISCGLEAEGHPAEPERLLAYFRLMESIGYCRLGTD